VERRGAGQTSSRVNEEIYCKQRHQVLYNRCFKNCFRHWTWQQNQHGYAIGVFQTGNIIPIEDAVKYLKDSIEKTYGKKGHKIVEMNNAAVDKDRKH